MVADRNRKKTFAGDLDWFCDKLTNHQPFAFARYSDGELYILQNKKLVLDCEVIQIDQTTTSGHYKSQDHKFFDPDTIQHAMMRQQLLQAFTHRQFNYYKGISCRCCVGDQAFNQQLELHGGDDLSLTWANLFVNSNYPRFIQQVVPILQTYPTIMVCHKDARLDNLGFVDKDFRVGYNAMINDQHVIAEIAEWIQSNNINNCLFLFSASTFSNLAIYRLFRDYPNNTYLDIGTCLTPYMDMPADRSYLQEYWLNQPGSDLKKVCIW